MSFPAKWKGDVAGPCGARRGGLAATLARLAADQQMGTREPSWRLSAPLGQCTRRKVLASTTGATFTLLVAMRPTINGRPPSGESCCTESVANI